MVDDKTKKVPEHSSQVRLEDDHEVKFWCIRFGCSRAELEHAVSRAGTLSTAVQAYLAKSGAMR